MKITLGQVDIEAAIKQYIGPTGWGMPIENKELTIEMKSHRGDKDNAFSAEIEVNDESKMPTSPAEDSDKDATEKVDENQQAIDFDFETIA